MSRTATEKQKLQKSGTPGVSVWYGGSLEKLSKAENSSDELGHPRGTLAIVITFGLLFGLAWLAMYLFLFLERGAPHS